jgi:hypothetical protein
MAFSALASPVPARPRLRFTLAGLFVCLLGIAVGLAYWRIAETSRQIPNALLASFSVWFVIGMWQQTAARWRQLCQSRELPKDIRCGLAVQCATSLGIMVVLILAAGMEIAARHRLLGLETHHSDMSIVARMVIDATFFLAVICAYWLPHCESRWQRSPAFRFWRLLLNGVALMAAVGLLAALLMMNTYLLGFIWIAIRGVENVLPTRWAGSELLPASFANESVMGPFIAGGTAAAGLLASAAAAIVLLIRAWRMGGLVRFAFALAASACLSGVAWLLHWCHDAALPQLSPTLAAEVGNQPAANLFLGWVILFAAVTALAIRLSVQTASVTVSNGVESPVRAPLLHERVAVVALCLAGIVSGIVIELWQNMRLVTGTMVPTFAWLYQPRAWWWLLTNVSEYLEIYDPANLLSFAAAFVLIHWLWRTYLGDLPHDEQWSVEPRQFAAAWLGSFAILVLAGPVFAWWGFALTLKFYFQL